MRIHPARRRWLASFLALATVTLPVGRALAQGRGGGNSRTSVSQTHHAPRPPQAQHPTVPPDQGRPPKPPHHPPPPAHSKPKPPHHHPPSYRPPHPPHYPAYRPPPPRHPGDYYGDYWAWRAVAGAAAVIAVGTVLATLPPASRTVVIETRTYYVYDGVYYERVLYGDRVAYQVVRIR